MSIGFLLLAIVMFNHQRELRLQKIKESGGIPHFSNIHLANGSFYLRQSIS
jgi:hypothetical protein